MMYLFAIVAVIMLSLVLVALLYRGKAKAEQQRDAMQQQRADAATATIDSRKKLDAALLASQQEHRQEITDEQQPEHLAQRADFTTDWPAAGLHDASAAATGHSAGTAAAGQAGAADPEGGRVGLPEW